MSTEEKRTHCIEFLGKKSNWETGKKSSSRLKNLLEWDKSSVKIDIISMWNEYEEVFTNDTDLDEKIVNTGQFNKLAYEDFILSVNTYSYVDKVHLDWFIMWKASQGKL